MTIPRPVSRAAAPLALAVLLGTGALAAQPTVRLPAADRALSGRPTQLFSIGAEEGQSWEMLSNVDDVAFDRADNLYVLDRGNQRVLVFDRSGRFVRQFGKKGDGPGEFQFPNDLTVHADGSIAVYDLAHRSFSLFGPDGAFRRSVPLGEDWGMPNGRMIQHPAGGVVGVLRPRPQFEAGQIRQDGAKRLTFARIPLAPNGSLSRLFEIPDPARVSGSESGTGGAQRIMIRMSPPPEFSPLTLWGVLPDGGTALSHTSLYTIKVQDANGRTVRFLQRPMGVRRPTDADKARARERAREAIRSGRGMQVIRMGGSGGPAAGMPSESRLREEMERRVNEMEFADTVRALQGMVVAPSGKLYIERTARNIGDPGPIDVVTPQGQYLGTITGTKLPNAISASGRAVIVERDDMGVERVVVVQLPPTWR